MKIALTAQEGALLKALDDAEEAADLADAAATRRPRWFAGLGIATKFTTAYVEFNAARGSAKLAAQIAHACKLASAAESLGWSPWICQELRMKLITAALEWQDDSCKHGRVHAGVCDRCGEKVLEVT